MTDGENPTATIVRTVLGVVARTLLKIVGTALVTRGLIDQGAADGIMATLVEAIVGATMVGAGSAWSFVHALFEHSRWAARWQALMALRPAAPAPPPSV